MWSEMQFCLRDIALLPMPPYTSLAISIGKYVENQMYNVPPFSSFVCHRLISTSNTQASKTDLTNDKIKAGTIQKSPAFPISKIQTPPMI